MSLRSTLFTAAAAVAFSAFSAGAATVLTVGADSSGADVETISQPNGSITLDFGSAALMNDDFTLDKNFNLQSQRSLLFDPVFFGTGSLTIGTFVDPYVMTGVGAADVLLEVGTTLVANSITVQWGSGPVIDLSSGMQTNISTMFASAGQVNDLIFTWTNLSRESDLAQASTNLKAGPAVIPIPAAGLLLVSALGGLGLARRRRKQEA